MLSIKILYEANIIQIRLQLSYDFYLLNGRPGDYGWRTPPS